MRGRIGEDRARFAADGRALKFGAGEGGESAGAACAAFSGESETGDPPFHGGRALPARLVRFQTGTAEAGGKTVAAISNWGATLRVHSSRRGGDGAAIPFFGAWPIRRTNFGSIAA